MTADALPRRQRVGAYAVCRDRVDRLLLCRMSARTRTPGWWTLPGGGVRHGEHPADAALRELTEETGLSGRILGLLGVHSDVYESRKGVSVHGVRLLYLVRINAGMIETEIGGGIDGAAWFALREAERLDLSAHAGQAVSHLKLPE